MAKNYSKKPIPPERRYELEKVADKSKNMASLWAFLVTPYGYYYVGKTGLALINLLTLNYFLVGWLVVPFHVRMIIDNARDELEREDYVEWAEEEDAQKQQADEIAGEEPSVSED